MSAGSDSAETTMSGKLRTVTPVIFDLERASRVGLTPQALLDVMTSEIGTLDMVQDQLWADLSGANLSPSQRLTALSEIRKTVYLRSLINGLISPKEAEG